MLKEKQLARYEKSLPPIGGRLQCSLSIQRLFYFFLPFLGAGALVSSMPSLALMAAGMASL